MLSILKNAIEPKDLPLLRLALGNTETSPQKIGKVFGANKAERIFPIFFFAKA
jgi:hypothetical protein